MIKWKQFSESSPDNRGMCLVCLPSCQITQSYYSEGLFYEPWGEVFPERIKLANNERIRRGSMKYLMVVIVLMSSPLYAGQVYLYTMFHDDNSNGERFRTKMKDMDQCLKVIGAAKMPMPTSPAGDYEVMGAMWCGGDMHRHHNQFWVEDKTIKVD